MPKSQCTQIAHDEQQPIDFMKLSVQSIMGAMDKREGSGFANMLRPKPILQHSVLVIEAYRTGTFNLLRPDTPTEA
jgi:hypothetical protein